PEDCVAPGADGGAVGGDCVTPRADAGVVGGDCVTPRADGGVVGGDVSSPPTFTTAGTTSSSSKMRSAEAIAACITVYFAPRSRMGRKKRVVYWMNATSVPNVSASAAIWRAPYHSSTASAAEPRASTDA